MELQELYLVVNRADWFGIVAPFIARSEAAIRAKMCALRREAGITPRNPGPTAKPASFMLRHSAVVGSERLRAAIEQLAA